jgi:penicillin amidase
MVPRERDITEYMDFSKNPSAVNPEWNFVYSANNQAEAVDGFYILVIIFQKTELKLQLLEPKSDWNKNLLVKCSTIILH